MKKLAFVIASTTTAAFLAVAACGVETETGSSGGITPDTGTSSGASSGTSGTSGTSSGTSGSSGTSSGSSGTSSGSSGTSSGSSGDAGPDATDAAADVTDAALDVQLDAADAADAATGIATVKSAANQVDLVGPGDQGLTADGTTDGTIEATVVGPIDGLILITTDANGDAAGGQQWDTVVLGDALPNIGTGFTLGGQTWVLGVYEGATQVNDADGRISLAAGVHNLTLVGSPSGFFNAGQNFRLYYRNATTGVWTAGPNFAW